MVLMKVKTRKPRCKKVLVILDNKVQTLDLIKEKVYPVMGDFDVSPAEFAIVRHENGPVHVALTSVVFLK